MDSASLKIGRAEKHLSELSSLFRKKKPFRYYLETNCKTGERATFSKRDEAIANDAAIIIGDIIHNLRSALDHAYWDCTNEFAKSEGEKRSIQFPIVSTEKALCESVLPGLPKRVSASFVTALASLKPYREKGNEMLCAIHDLDVIDKHKLLVPTGNFTKITSAMIQKQVPDFPGGIMGANIGNCHRDVVWQVMPMTGTQRRKAKIPRSNILEQELNVPVEISLHVLDPFNPALETLKNLVKLAKESIQILYEGAKVDAAKAL